MHGRGIQWTSFRFVCSGLTMVVTTNMLVLLLKIHDWKNCCVKSEPLHFGKRSWTYLRLYTFISSICFDLVLVSLCFLTCCAFEILLVFMFSTRECSITLLLWPPEYNHDSLRHNCSHGDLPIVVFGGFSSCKQAHRGWLARTPFQGEFGVPPVEWPC